MGTVSEYFGSMVFDDRVMKANLSAKVYASLKKTIDEGAKLDISVANAVATAMKDWAVAHGATHYTHWFQPLTGITAEKHDSFISPSPDGGVIMEFSGKELIKGEPDASSFPSGGLRATFEARGYTAWDPTSYAFIKGKTLCIPTAFCSYAGHALDKKTPLLRSMEALNKQALRILRLFGNDQAKCVRSSVGPEQEYFLVTKEMYDARPDLRFTGRTLFGAKPPKGQEMDDHYFGVIKPRVAAYMEELNHELWKLGILAKTEHNEVAPAQHELAPIYTTTNIATDHNQLTMEIMQKVAAKHGLVCLLHEKPFAGVNGSGKHNNWSLSANDGTNLLDPGKNPYENMQFLIMLCAVITAVDRHAALLRMSAAVAGNDERLGGHEAPPAIISIFLGEQLTSVLREIAKGHSPMCKKMSSLDTGVPTLPAFTRDDSDRNRTSPFAFTGNKFEFRMVGSSASIACANYVLNTIVAESLDEICTRLEQSRDFDAEVQAIIHDTMEQHGRIIFNGNNYTDEWVKTAESLGIVHLRDTIEAASAYIDPKSVEVLSKYHVLTPVECEARYEILLENYAKIVTIEAKTMLEMTHRELLPAIIKTAGETAQSASSLASCSIAQTRITELAQTLSDCAQNVFAAQDRLSEALSDMNQDGSAYECAIYARDTVKPLMASLRAAVDEAEELVAKENWPIPNYTDLLHRV